MFTMANREIAISGLLFATRAAAQFNVYPPVDPTVLANAFNIRSGCLTALNATVSCDQTLLTMAGTVDDYLWAIDKVTALCTKSCLSSAQTWYDNVNNSWSSDTMAVMGKQVPRYTIAGRTSDGLNITCQTPTTNISMDAGIAASCVIVTNETDSSDTPSSKACGVCS